MLAMILQPAGFLALLLGSPPGDDREPASLLDPESLRSVYVVHPLKGGVLTLFYLVNGVNIGLLVGVNGIGLDPSFFLYDNSLFYASMGIGVAVGTIISYLAARTLFLAPGSARKDRNATIFLLGTVPIQLFSWFGAVAIEILGDGYHGSFIAQLVDGTAVGVILSLQIAVTLVFHPPRGFVAHVMLAAFCMGFFIVFGQVLKAIALGSASIESLQEYLPWILAPELVILVIIGILATIPAIGKHSWLKMLREKESENK